jgi:cytochrome d ubiquinol oxidase subunit II
MLEPSTLLGAAMLGALVLYALFGGADFGGGVWHLFARGPTAEKQRQLIAHAIGPIWEANHVWLILVVVVLFTGFPAAFAAISVLLHAPLTLLLIAIVLRGAAFAFRSAAGDRQREARGWGWVFALSSVAAPILLGMILAALASGRLQSDLARLWFPTAGETSALTWVGPWTTAFAILTGLFTLVLFSFLAAVYLTLETQDELRELFRRRAIVAGVSAAPLALATYLLAGDGAPMLRKGLSESFWAEPLQLATAIAAVAALGALWKRRYPLARFAAAAQVALIVVGWGASQYPYLIVPGGLQVPITLTNASAPAATQRMLLGALIAGAVVLLPSLWALFRVFKNSPERAG